MKIVINRVYGGYSLSDGVLKLILSILGLPAYQLTAEIANELYTALDSLWKIPEESLIQLEAYKHGKFGLLEEHFKYSDYMFSDDRSNIVLVQAVEQAHTLGLGTSLKVVEIPDDVNYIIQEYDGVEWIAEKHRTWS